MRPISLELQYIGPYENETIDFKDINQTLFLISGKTGSGKSMIFDAITHALFATASTSIRGTESLRSQFAPSTEPSIITFTFMYRGKTYKVERRLRYFRGTNKTETPPESSIYNEFGELIENGLTKVTSFIIELLQLSATQFRQIGLLPQGEFRKFLVASSSDKEEILKALFRTERFNELYLKLKKNHDKDKQQIEMKHALIMNQFSQVLKEEEQSTSFKENLERFHMLQLDARKELQEVEESYQKTLESKDLLSKEIQSIKENNDRVETYFKEKDNLELLLQQKSVIDDKEAKFSLSQKVHTIKDAYFIEKEYSNKVKDSESRVNGTRQVLDEKTSEKKKIDSEFKDLLNKEPEINEYKVRAKLFSKYDTEEYQSIEQDILNLLDRQENQSKSLETKKEELTDLEVSISKMNVTDEKIRKSEAEFFSVKENLFTLQNELEIAKESAQNKREIDDLTETIHSIELEIEKLSLTIEKQNQEVQSLNNLNVKSVNEMIAHLEAGKPCVVCQQTVAQIPDTIDFDEALYSELESKQKSLDSLKMRLGILSEKDLKETRSSKDLETEILKLERELSQREAQIASEARSLEEKKVLEVRLYELKSEVSEFAHGIDISKREVEILEKRFSQFKEETNFDDFLHFKDALNIMEADIDTFLKNKKSLEDKGQTLTLELTKLESQLESSLYKLETERNILDENSQKVRVFLSKNNELSVEDLESLIELDNDALKTEIETYKNKVAQVESLILHLKKDIETFEVVDLTNKLSEERHLNESINIESKRVGQLESRLKSLDGLYKKIENEIETYKKEEHAFTELVKLVELLGGKQGTPTLSRFVLVYYLERILSQANIRLRKMTNGRYELRRRESYRSDQALHIDVFDYFNNARRSVATLSGGESFQAALALALALSEIIQHESGSIDMDMLLIDEGFGTLDEETLKVAIDTLFDLQKSGKMIGIISHVEELKTMIGNVLYVETLDERSRTKLVTPLSN